jgi:pimeloyl-ACP methyl ester carboxylesterase
VAAKLDTSLPIGTLRYRDEGTGPTLVFVHGIFADSSLWDPVIERLSNQFRCVAPDLPLGSHTIPATPGADLSPRGIARAIDDFLARLDLREVTLIANDTGGAIAQLLLAAGCDRIARVVLTPCDSFANFPPPAIQALVAAPRVPGALALGAQLMRSRKLQKYLYGTLAKGPLATDTMHAWTHPFITNPAIRRDIGHFLQAIDNADTIAAAEQLRDFDKPVLLVWPRKAPYFPFQHAQRWVELLPDARLVEAPDSYTYISLDQPDFLAREISAFAGTATSQQR